MRGRRGERERERERERIKIWSVSGFCNPVYKRKWKRLCTPHACYVIRGQRTFVNNLGSKKYSKFILNQ